MKCPFCGHHNNRVVDSRDAADGEAIRRRRECSHCRRRFTTYERPDLVLPMIVKKDGRREPYCRDKVLVGLQKACEKRPVPADAIDRIVALVERRLHESGTREVESSVIGETIMDALKELDDVAYVRFASVYKSFRDIDEFQAALETIVRERRRGTER
ncbi:MAG: transcriptional repressor NrdR [Candidatus Dadabacteria bacterium]|nr:MAG: transcriptional repressor NrdR [Candidatus Dadabacteria bacterium]